MSDVELPDVEHPDSRTLQLAAARAENRRLLAELDKLRAAAPAQEGLKLHPQAQELLDDFAAARREGYEEGRAAAAPAPRDMASDWPPEVVQKHVERLTGLLADGMDAAAAPAPEGLSTLNIPQDVLDNLTGHEQEYAAGWNAALDHISTRPVLSDETLREMAEKWLSSRFDGHVTDGDMNWMAAFARAVLSRQQERG